MSVALLDEPKTRHFPRGVMKARHVPLTAICTSSDLQTVKGKYPVNPGLTLGHEAFAVIQELGAGVTGYAPGQRVLAGAITPCGQCESCLGGHTSRCTSQVGAPGAWRLGNTIHGTQAEYVLIPHAQANLAVIPNALSDEQVLLLAHVASTGFACAEQSGITLGIAVDRNSARLAPARQYGASATVQSREDLVARLQTITDSRGIDVACVDVASEPGVEDTFESALCVLRPGGTLSSVGVSCGHVRVPPDASGTVHEPTCGSGRQQPATVTTLCPGHKERVQVS